MYRSGQIVLATDIGLNKTGELVQLLESKVVAGFGWFYRHPVYKGHSWMRESAIIRAATPDEIITFDTESDDIILAEIKQLENKLDVLRKGLKNARG